MTKKELAQKYNISSKTFSKWMSVLVVKHKHIFITKMVKHKNRFTKKKKATMKETHTDHLLTPAQVRVFVNHYGEP